ncbi:MAG: major capsid protein [Arizlama microvirus]|nr:MAG: major capsid protein [Arizlama microvirus]
MGDRNPYQSVGTVRPGRSAFDLSYDKKFTCDMGQLIPVQCDEVIPSDKIILGNQCTIRFQPMVAPILHEVNMYSHTFFVPYRLLDDNWTEFITGGKLGTDASSIPEWHPTNGSGNIAGTLWDYLGFPIGIDPELTRPIDYPRRAYNLIYNEYYIDRNLTADIALTNEAILNRCWEKDYFTSSLPFQQRGVSPALPITGTTSAVWDTADIILDPGGTHSFYTTNANNTSPYAYGTTANARDNIEGFMNNNTVDLSVASTFDMADLRLAMQIQKWMERNARCGSRYTEHLMAHYSVHNDDLSLSRPVYIGGTKSSIIISEVLQTSSTDVTSPQGNLAGHGITATNSFTGKYHVKEFGLIMTLMSVMPRSAYQDGINRQWLRRTRYDFPYPEFANLSEQAIEEVEICAHDGNTINNKRLFGYQGRYDECRTKDNMVVGQMRDTFDYWHLGRQFDPANPPALNTAFVTCVPRKDIFAVPSEPALIVQFANLIKAIRPLPIQAEPGLIDHN